MKYLLITLQWFFAGYSIHVEAQTTTSGQYISKPKGAYVEPVAGEFGSSGINIDLAKKLNGVGLLRDSYLETFRNSNANLDKMYLLRTAMEAYRSNNHDSLLTILAGIELISSDITTAYQALIHSEAPSRPTFHDIMLILMLKEKLGDSTIRNTIVENAISKGYTTYEQNPKIADAFIQGKIELPDFLLSFDFLHPCPSSFQTKDLSAIADTAATFLSLILPELGQKINAEVSQGNGQSGIIIYAGGESYDFDLEYHYLNTNEKSTPEKAQKMNNSLVYVNTQFYQNLLLMAKQIAVDNNIKKAFDIGYFPSGFSMPAYTDEDYINLIIQYPSLKLFNTTHYVTAIPKADIELLMNKIPISFLPAYTNEDTRQVELYGFNGLGDSGIDYIPTKQKKEIIKYLNAESNGFVFSKEDSEDLEAYILSNLISNSAELISLLPHSSLRLSSEDNDLPKLNSGNNSFHVVFPDLYHFLKTDFNASNLRYDETGEYLLWMDVNGKTIKVKKGRRTPKESILAAIQPYLATSGKGIFYESTISFSGQTYYYLSTLQKQELQRLLNMRLDPIR